MSDLLSELCKLPLEARTQFVLRNGERELREAVRRFEREYIRAALTEEQLAWAVAFNFEAYGELLDEPGTWEQLWDKLTARPLLVELALSVACEQRGDGWQHPSRQIDFRVAEQAFGLAYARKRAKVEGYIRGRFRLAGDRAEEIAQEAWFRIFRDRWSPTAQKRFCGLCSISTFVCYIAHNLATTKKDRLIPLARPELVQSPRQQERFDAVYEDCIERLPPMQQVVISRLRQDQTSVVIAGKLGITEAAVSQRLTNAKRNLRDCMEGAGYRVAE